MPSVDDRQWPLVGRGAELAVVEAMLAASRPLVISGRAGVGKTRLIGAVLEGAEARGARVVRATGTRAAREIPLGAVAHLLDLDALAGRPDPEGLVRALATGLRDVDAEVLAVDDAHLLDGPSSVLVRGLIDARVCQVVLGTRTGETLPDPVLGVIRDGSAGVVEIHELAEPELAELLAQVLGPMVDRAVPRRLWAVTRGNPLFVRELIRVLRTSGALGLDDGWWRWDGQVPATATLAGLLDERAARLDEAHRFALDVVALGEPLDLRLVEAVAGVAEVAALERAGLLSVSGPLGEAWVTTAHPLIGETARGLLPVTRARHIRRSLAEALDASGPSSVEDSLRSAVWRLDGGDRPDPHLAVQAARAAWVAGDPGLAERLARSAIGSAGDGEARYLLAEALADRGAYDEALGTWASLAADDDPKLRVSALCARCQTIGLGLGRPGDALALLDAATAADRGLECEEVRAVRTGLLTLQGGPALSAATAAGLGASPESEQAELMGYMSTMTVDLLAGRTAPVADRLPRAEQLAVAHASAMPDAAMWIGIIGFFVEYCEGAIARAERTANERLDAVLVSASLARSFWTYALGLALLQRGRAEEGGHLLAEATALHRADVRTMSRGTLDALAVARALSGDPVGARQALTEAAGHAPRVFDPIGPLRAEAWVLAAEGALAQAAQTARRCADEDRASGRSFFELAALHDAARLGDSRLVAERVAEVAAGIDGAYARAVVDHVGGLAGRDRERLVEAATAFEAMGADLLAAEGWSAAAEAAGRAGLAAEAHRCAERRDRARERCGPVSTPALLVQRWVDPLSRREREVALLAAAGATDREIAERLVVSVRTVHAHLRSVYAKLGVAGRAQLREVLDRATQSVPPSPEPADPAPLQGSDQ